MRTKRSFSDALCSFRRGPDCGETGGTGAKTGALYAVILELLPKVPQALPVGLGSRVHAAFLALIRLIDPELSASLHAPQERQRPFTLSLLRESAHRQDGQLWVSFEKPLLLRITMLKQQIYDRLMYCLLAIPDPPTLHLGTAELVIHRVLGTPESSPWSGHTNWESLVAEASADTEVTLEFASPTVFRRGEVDLPLPVPELVFGSYLAKWLAFSPVRLDSALAEQGFFARHVGVKEHRIRTVPFSDGRVTIPGFVGRCTFILKGKLDSSIIRQVNALADFAFYAGTGRKTTHGMGMTRRVR